MCAYLLSHVLLFVIPGTVASQATLFMGFSRQEYWSGLPCPPPGDLPNPEIEPRSTTFQADSLPSEPPGKSDSVDQILIPTRSSVMEEERSKSKSSSRTITNLYIAGSQPGASINSVENSYMEGSKWTVAQMVYDYS